MYVCYGVGNYKESIGTMHKISLDKNSKKPFLWEKLPQTKLKPKGRDSHSCVVIDNKMLFFGGRNINEVTNEVWVFDTTSQKFHKLNIAGDVPCPRESHSSVLLQDMMVVFGGVID